MHIPAFLFLCLFAFGLACIRVIFGYSSELFPLIWNLVLAMIPFFFAFGFVTIRSSLRWIFFPLWILFLPNSFYIVTDFIHLYDDTRLIYFDIIFILTCTIAGIVTGFASIDLIRRYFHGKKRVFLGWSIVIFSIFLSTFGVYIGRFFRFNSWDIFTDPLHVIWEIMESIATNGMAVTIHSESRLFESERFSVGVMGMWQFILLYGSFFLLLYLFIYAVKKEKGLL